MLEYRDVYAGGRLVGSGSADVITIVNPATEEVAGAVPSMVGADVEVAVAAARKAFDAGPWPQAAPADRAAAMDRLAAAIEARAEDTARLVTAEMGMPIRLSRRNNVSIPCGIIRYYAALARDMSTEEMREAVSFAGRTMVRREPVGVAAVIASWSYPLILAFCQLAPALAAGCTIVLKPAAETSLSAYILAEAFEAADFPPGVFNLVTGTGQVAEMLAAHPGVDIVAVAGPTPSGRRIAAICGETLKPVSLELGGKSAAIVLDDVDLDATAAELGCLCFANSGQACFTMSRVLAPRTRYDEAVEALACPGVGPGRGRSDGRRDDHGAAGQPAAAGPGGILGPRPASRRARGSWPAAAARPRRCAATTTSPPCSPTPTPGWPSPGTRSTARW